MGYRLGEMNDLLLQRELRSETQIYDLSNQMNSVLHAIDGLRREQSRPRSSREGMKTGNFSASNVAKPVKGPSVGLYLKPSLAERDSVEAPKPRSFKLLKLNPTSEVRAEQPMHVMPDNERKSARVQIKGPHDSSSAVQSTATLSGTRDQGVDPNTIYLDSFTEVDLSNTKGTLGSKLMKMHTCQRRPCQPCT